MLFERVIVPAALVASFAVTDAVFWTQFSPAANDGSGTGAPADPRTPGHYYWDLVTSTWRETLQAGASALSYASGLPWTGSPQGLYFSGVLSHVSRDLWEAQQVKFDVLEDYSFASPWTLTQWLRPALSEGEAHTLWSTNQADSLGHGKNPAIQLVFRQPSSGAAWDLNLEIANDDAGTSISTTTLASAIFPAVSTYDPYCEADWRLLSLTYDGDQLTTYLDDAEFSHVTGVSIPTVATAVDVTFGAARWTGPYDSLLGTYEGDWQTPYQGDAAEIIGYQEAKSAPYIHDYFHFRRP